VYLRLTQSSEKCFKHKPVPIAQTWRIPLKILYSAALVLGRFRKFSESYFLARHLIFLVVVVSTTTQALEPSAIICPKAPDGSLRELYQKACSYVFTGVRAADASVIVVGDQLRCTYPWCIYYYESVGCGSDSFANGLTAAQKCPTIHINEVPDPYIDILVPGPNQPGSNCKSQVECCNIYRGPADARCLIDPKAPTAPPEGSTFCCRTVTGTSKDPTKNISPGD